MSKLTIFLVVFATLFVWVNSTDIDSAPIDVEDPYSGGSMMMGKMMMGKMMGKGMQGKMAMGTGNQHGKMMTGGKMGMGTGTASGKPKDNSISGTVADFIMNAPKPVQFLGGLAMGVLGSIPFSPTKTIAGVDAVQNDLQNLFRKFSLKSGSAVANDVVLLANTIKDFTGLLKSSGAIEVAEKAAKVAAKAESPIGWIIGAGELALNGVNVYQDFQAAIEAFHTGNLFECGKKVGDIISILAD